MENTAALLEELGINNKAIYLPSNEKEGHPRAIIPLSKEVDSNHLQNKLPGRLIVRYGPNAEEMALAISTPGSVNLEMLGNKPGPTADDIQAALTYLLTGVLDIASTVSVNIVDSQVYIDIGNAKMHYEDIWYYHSLGSPLASISATISSEALGKPIRIKEESFSKGKAKIALEILP
jgi:hypothetical protein